MTKRINKDKEECWEFRLNSLLTETFGTVKGGHLAVEQFVKQLLKDREGKEIAGDSPILDKLDDIHETLHSIRETLENI